MEINVGLILKNFSHMVPHALNIAVVLNLIAFVVAFYIYAKLPCIIGLMEL